MSIRRTLIHASRQLQYGFHKLTGTGGFDRHRASYFRDPASPAGNGLKAGLFRRHVKQFNESSCSVASVVTVVNAIRDLDGSGPIPISQTDILDQVRTASWKERMTSKGYKGRRGLPLAVLRDVVEESLHAYAIAYTTVEAVQAVKDEKSSMPIKALLRKRLRDFEERGDCVVIAHFDQGVYLPTLNIPHISPVGGFDPETGKVVILDVDSTQEKFYGIDFETFYRGLSSNYYHMLKPFGYGSGGYVFIQLPQPALPTKPAPA